MGRLAWGDVGKVMVGVVFAVALVPVAASASGQLVTLVDQDTASKAQVDAGRLRIGDGAGALTIDGRLTDSRRGQSPWHEGAIAYTSGTDHSMQSATFTVPNRKRLVLTHVSALVEVPSELDVAFLRLVVGNDNAIIATTLGYDSSAVSGTRRFISYDADLEILIDANQPVYMIAESYGDGDKSLKASFFGYLVDA